jgi:hypothetical protein
MTVVKFCLSCCSYTVLKKGAGSTWRMGKNYSMVKFFGEIPVFQLAGSNKLRKKCPEVPARGNYSSNPGKEFWMKFPKCNLPEKAFSKIWVNVLKDKLASAKGKLTDCELRRGLKCVENLSEGANAFQRSELPPCSVENAQSTIKHGEAVTDAVASWVKEGYASGPFDFPPLSNFRVNSLMAIPQGDKVRPILNVSLPEGRSLNSNVRERALEKVIMCSVRCFSYSIMDAGREAWMFKPD